MQIIPDDSVTVLRPAEDSSIELEGGNKNAGEKMFDDMLADSVMSRK